MSELQEFRNGEGVADWPFLGLARKALQNGHVDVLVHDQEAEGEPVEELFGVRFLSKEYYAADSDFRYEPALFAKRRLEAQALFVNRSLERLYYRVRTTEQGRNDTFDWVALRNKVHYSVDE